MKKVIFFLRTKLQLFFGPGYTEIVNFIYVENIIQTFLGTILICIQCRGSRVCRVLLLLPLIPYPLSNIWSNCYGPIYQSSRSENYYRSIGMFYTIYLCANEWLLSTSRKNYDKKKSLKWVFRNIVTLTIKHLQISIDP